MCGYNDPLVSRPYHKYTCSCDCKFNYHNQTTYSCYLTLFIDVWLGPKKKKSQTFLFYLQNIGNILKVSSCQRLRHMLFWSVYIHQLIQITIFKLPCQCCQSTKDNQTDKLHTHMHVIKGNWIILFLNSMTYLLSAALLCSYPSFTLKRTCPNPRLGIHSFPSTIKKSILSDAKNLLGSELEKYKYLL